MAPSNIALVEQIVGALNRADVEGMIALLDPDFEWIPLEDSPAPGPCRGHAQVRRYVQDWLDTLETLRLELDDPVEMGDTVVVGVDGQARGRTSGLELSNRFCQVWTLSGGSAVRMREYRTRAEALRATRATVPGPGLARDSTGTVDT
jgi:ketosteroid isomerase-like protein